MQYKIGVYGSAVLTSEETTQKAHDLGKALGKHNFILITGAGKGLPYQVVYEAKKKNDDIQVWGFPPMQTREALEAYTTDDLSIYTKLTYIPSDFSFAHSIHACRLYRNSMSTAACDAGIIISGRWGTLNEFTNLHEAGKVIGVLTGTGGVADELEHMVSKVTKESAAKVVFDSNPEVLVKKVLEELEKRVF